MMRMGLGPDRANRGLQNVVERLADGCRMVTEYAAQKGIRTMVENHGFFLQDADRVEKLINTVNHPNFGWLCDMGNFLCADEDPAKSCGKAAPYVFYVHAKDFIVKSGNEPNPGEGFFSFPCRKLSERYHYWSWNGAGKTVSACAETEGYDGYLGGI